MAASKKGIHLIAEHVVIADRWTQRDTPADYYAVHGDLYDVTSYQAIHEPDGSAGFDVQVTIRPRA